MTTFLEPRDYNEYLSALQRRPVHLLRILPAEEMHVELVGDTPITNTQVSLFDSQSFIAMTERRFLSVRFRID